MSFSLRFIPGDEVAQIAQVIANGCGREIFSLAQAVLVRSECLKACLREWWMCCPLHVPPCLVFVPPTEASMRYEGYRQREQKKVQGNCLIDFLIAIIAEIDANVQVISAAATRYALEHKLL